MYAPRSIRRPSRAFMHFRSPPKPRTRRAPSSSPAAAKCWRARSKKNYRDHIVARGDLTAAALRQKAVGVLSEVKRRLPSLGGTWRGTTAAQPYTVEDIDSFLEEVIQRPGTPPTARTGLSHRPPVVKLQ